MAAALLKAANTIRSASGDELFALIAPRWVDSILLAADTPAVYTLPANANYVVFQTNDDSIKWYARYSDNAAAPTWPIAGNVTDGSDWWPSPEHFALDESTFDRVHLVAGSAVRIHVACYAIQTR